MKACVRTLLQAYLPPILLRLLTSLALHGSTFVPIREIRSIRVPAFDPIQT